MDHRDVAARKGKWYESLDEKRMIATAEVWDEDGDDIEVEVPFKYEVCPTCDGKGKHVNPSIDSHGISPEEFDEDPGFREDYMSGMYDVPCYECGGQRVVPMPDETTENGKLALEKMHQQAQWAAEEAHAARMGY
jgi:hypothetical protein